MSAFPSDMMSMNDAAVTGSTTPSFARTTDLAALVLVPLWLLLE